MPNNPPRPAPQPSTPDALAEVSASDVERAVAWWKSHASAKGKAMVDAQPEPPKEPKA